VVKPLGVVELASAVIYLIPQTAVLGAILLTGYMGGAIATHVRLEEPFIIQTMIGVVVWLGIFLRDARLRQLIPLRR
jgi:Mn2+/Fe2+ NRAMP family transporter